MSYVEVFKLTDSITTLNFSPVQGYNKPDELELLINRAEAGNLYVYKKYLKRKWEIPLKLIDKVTADQINLWRESLTLLTFFPDMPNTPYTSFIVMITNPSRPLSSMSEYTWETVYDGNLILQEV